MKHTRSFLLMLLLVIVGCGSKTASIEDTINQYYEYIIEGDMDKANKFLDWEPKQGDIIDYFAGLNELRSRYKLTSFEGIEIVSIDEADKGTSNVVINLIYLDDTNEQRVETNNLLLKLNEKKKWKIKSITREILE